MTIYYVDSLHGSDKNNGTSAGSALKSIAQLNTVTLKPGDTVLLARGSTFTDALALKNSGTASAPITISAYGTGIAPTFTGSQGVQSAKPVSYINISNVTFSTSGDSIYANGAGHWTIDHVTVKDAGASTGTGSIMMKNVSDMTITNSTFDGVNNDGIFMQNVNGLTASGNSFTRLQGVTADGIQVSGGSNLVFTDNHIDQTTSPDSQKGGIMVEQATGVTVSNNTVLGGTFGLGINGDDVTITGNTLDGQNRWTWSAGILISSNENVSDYTISNNTVVNGVYGVAITGLTAYTATHDNVSITDNTFADVSGAALKVDKVATGMFEDNVVVDGKVSTIRGDGLLGTFTVADNTSLAKPATINTAPVATLDTATLTVTATTISGNILTNDWDAQGDKLTLHSVGSGDLTGKAVIDVDGTYGTLHIDASGNYTYMLHSDAMAQLGALKGAVFEDFNYKISDLALTGDSKLKIDLSAYTQPAEPNVAPVAVADRIAYGAAASTAGNVLANDTDANGDALRLISTASVQMSGSNTYDIDGKYGALHIATDGDYSYTLYDDAEALFPNNAAKVTDSFVYKITDNALTSSASLIIDLTSYAHDHTLM